MSASKCTQNAVDAKLAKILQHRRNVGTLRTLQVHAPNAIDFFSNDYLGVAKSTELQRAVDQRKATLKQHQALGATGSRLISGNSEYFMRVEKELTAFYNSEAALLFNSGYAANQGVLSSVPQDQDYVLYDEYIHNSCHEGIRLSRAHRARRTGSFRHNDLTDLRQQLERLTAHAMEGQCIYVVVESLYSMDGDVAPLSDIVALCERFQNAFVIVDEAHGVGAYGPRGSGIVCEHGLEARTDIIVCRVYTFGKAMGCHGAVVCGSQVLIDYLVNYARSFVYSTAFPFEQLVVIQCAHEFVAAAENLRTQLRDRVRYFKTKVEASVDIPRHALLPSDSAIQGLVFSGNRDVLDAAEALRKQGICIVPIRSPTVPKGAERLRVIIHADNSEAEIDQLIAALVTLFQGHKRRSSKL
ncbi:TPA: hypothetical protein N0F65_002782 [Lagenidium giganteum]|uniref:Aminotransferase class I/classII large domain-containing protein n=1 Tax=Lagenidium giganteum TaxID=4803 RepID=A0AAV2YNX9_9STRA|nr:TPA: hypothetical protein N0F65_002782 [Lagenidium giganteum]